jgi:sortase A
VGHHAGYGDPVFGKLLGAFGKFLIISGLLVLGFVAYQLWGTGLETSRGQSVLTDELAQDLSSTVTTSSETVELSDLTDQLAQVDPATAPATEPPAEGEPIGIISIPRIDVERVVVQGVSKADLKKGPGHYPGTPLPGQPGNSGIAGHRTTYGAPFNRIDELVPGDEIRVATPQGQFTYAVIAAPGQPADGQAWYTVTPDDVSVLEDKGDDRLTLTACHPKYSAKQRIIVHAVLKGPVAAATVATPTEQADAPDQIAEEFDQGLEGDPDALPRVLLFGGAAAAVALLAWFLSRFTRPWVVWLVATPAILVLVWFGYVYMDRFLPAL